MTHLATNKNKATPATALNVPPAELRHGLTPEEWSQRFAEFLLTPDLHANLVIEKYMDVSTLPTHALVGALSGNADKVGAGDLKQAEAMLMTQAYSLQAMFTTLARTAATMQNVKNWEAYMRMALKTQNQCRMTLETLANVKNPPLVIARQANINNGGQQQVNNGTSSPAATSRAEKSISEPNKLLEQQHGKRLDTRAAGKTGRHDQDLEAVETIVRTKDRGRKRAGGTQRVQRRAKT